MSSRKVQLLRRAAGQKGRNVAVTREEKALRAVLEQAQQKLEQSGGGSILTLEFPYITTTTNEKVTGTANKTWDEVFAELGGDPAADTSVMKKLYEGLTIRIGKAMYTPLSVSYMTGHSISFELASSIGSSSSGYSFANIRGYFYKNGTTSPEIVCLGKVVLG